MLEEDADLSQYQQLCTLLNEIFSHTVGLEQKYVAASEFKAISVNDMHILQAIGKTSSKNMSTVAKKVGVTVGTLTIAINNLVKKDYVRRKRSDKDRRVVLISLSPQGQRALKYHEDFYAMVEKQLESQMPEELCKPLVEALSKVNRHFLGGEK